MIEFSASAKKGAIVRMLARAIAEKLGRVHGPAAPLLKQTALQSKRAANQLIAAAPAGSTVTVRISLEDDALGGWSSVILVNMDPARER